MEYKISVIMPVYNAEKFLKDAMDSLIGQTIGFENLQVIMVDDCSTDESPRMMAEYAKQYANVELYKTEVNSGAAGTPRNIGLEHVKAPYIMFLDPDDFYDLDACRALYEKIVETGVEIVSGCFCFVNQSGEKEKEIYWPDDEKRVNSPENILDAFKISGEIWNRIYNACFVARHQLRFTSQGYGQDAAFTCKCLVQPCCLIYTPVWVLYYRYNDESVTHALSEKSFEKWLPGRREIRETLAPYPEMYQWMQEAMAAHSFRKSVEASNLDREALIRVYQTYGELFTRGRKYAQEEDRLALELICDGQFELAAQYALVVREHEREIQKREDIIRQHEERLVSRVADAINQRHFADVCRICFEAVRKKFN